MRLSSIVFSMLALWQVGCASADFGGARLRDVALPLDAPWPAAVPEAAAERFARESAGRRFVALGEGDHYVAEKHLYQLAFLRWLVAHRGLRHMTMELGASDAQRVDRYLETGDERWLRRVVLYGYTGETEREKRDLKTYTLREPPPPGFVDDHWRFFRALRRLAEEARAADGERLHLHGYDLDSHPGGGYEDARLLLGACAPGPVVDEVMQALTQPAGISGMDEVARLEGVVARLDAGTPDLAPACGSAVAAQVRDTIDTLAASFRHMIQYFETEREASDASRRRLAEIYDRREARMEARFAALVAGLAETAPVAVLGHNAHVARASHNLTFAPRAPGLPFWPTLGTRIEARYPGQLYVVWMTYAHGTRLGPPKGEEAPVSPRRGTLEQLLDDELAQPSLIFLRDVPAGSVFDRPLDFGTPTTAMAGVLRDSLDALVFLPRASAPRVAP